jgi:hypothetical protein
LKNIIRSLAIVAVVCSMAPLALAGKNPVCPKCKMEFSSKKDKAHPVAVKMKNGKTYYCCAACGAHKVVTKPPVKKHKGK